MVVCSFSMHSYSVSSVGFWGFCGSCLLSEDDRTGGSMEVILRTRESVRIRLFSYGFCTVLGVDVVCETLLS